MSFFVDTNVTLGYTIIHDKYHESSKNFIENMMTYLVQYKKQKILEHFWIKYNIREGISEQTYLKFKKFNKNFKKMYFK